MNETTVKVIKGGYVCNRTINGVKYFIDCNLSDNLLSFIHTDDNDFINMSNRSEVI